MLNYLCDDLGFNRVPLFTALEYGFVFKAFGKMLAGKAFLGKMRPEFVRGMWNAGDYRRPDERT